MTVVPQSWYMTVRHFRNLLRQPIWILITLVQPLIWLLLYGALFKQVVEIPGFGARLLPRLPHARHRGDERAVLRAAGAAWRCSTTSSAACSTGSSSRRSAACR